MGFGFRGLVRAVGVFGIQSFSNLSFYEVYGLGLRVVRLGVVNLFLFALSRFVRFASAREINAQYCKQMEAVCEVRERLLHLFALQPSITGQAVTGKGSHYNMLQAQSESGHFGPSFGFGA